MSLFPVDLEEPATDTIGLDGQRTIYNIPEANYPRFEREIAKLSKKSVRMIGLPILPVPIGYKIIDTAMGLERKIIEVYLQAEPPKLAGWTFVARLDHSNETGNVIRSVPNTGVELPEKFRTVAPNCDHCNIRRKRRDTFVIRNDETGEFQQVGSTCLADFLGHDPYKIARLAEYLAYASEAGRSNEEVDEDAERALNNRRTVNLEEYLLFCAKAVLQHGWVSAKAARESENGRGRLLVSTREQAENLRQKARYDAQFRDFTNEERVLVEKSLEWAQEIAENPQSDYEHNIAVIANALYIEPRSCGLAASIVGVFYNKARRNVVVPTQIGKMTGIVELLSTASKNLKAPKIRMTFDEGKPLALNIGKDGTKWAGTVFLGDGEYQGQSYGMIKPDGEFIPGRAVSPKAMKALTEVLAALAKNPAATASKYGRLTGKCCFCNQGLNDERSTQVGYGPVCAKSYDLPWGA
jgi:hypothetical protein